MYGGIYSAPMDAIAFTTATDLFEFTVATDRPVRILGLRLCQTTDVLAADQEVLRIGLYRDVTAGSGGTALTEAIYGNESSTAAVSLAVRSGGTASTGGELIDIIGWQIVIPLTEFWLPELTPKFSAIAAEGPVNSFRLLSAPTDSVTVSGALIWQEL